MNIKEQAYEFAKKCHAGQLDDSGEAYIWHPAAVAKLVQTVSPNDENLIAAAYLHDVIEDCGVTHRQLAEKFNYDIADLVNEVTHEGQKDSVGYYFPRLKTQRGIVLKFADRMSNLSRMECWDEKRVAQYLRKSKFWNDGNES